MTIRSWACLQKPGQRPVGSTGGFWEKGIEAGRRPELVGGGLIRSVVCFLAVRELGITATELARRIGLTQPAISISVKRGAGIVKKEMLSIDDFLA